MGWQDLLGSSIPETLTFPWTGGRSLRSGAKTWRVNGKLPKEHTWAVFEVNSKREANFKNESQDFDVSVVNHDIKTGYLVGDRFISDQAAVDPDPSNIQNYSETVYLIEPGLDRFCRVKAGRLCEGGLLIFLNQEMPLGPEDAVLNAFFNSHKSIDNIPGVPPALDASFRMEVWQREEVERRRIELERIRKEEEEQRLREERRQELIHSMGSGSSRREMALVDFAAAARAALAVGGAEYLDHRASYNKNEMVVQYRVDNSRFECTCDKASLRIIDAGICLNDHATGEKGDTRFSLESLPAVVLEARRKGKLVVFRHVGGEDYRNNYDDDDYDDDY